MRFGLGSYAYRWSTMVKGYLPEHPMTIDAFITKAILYRLDGIQICDNLPFMEQSEERLKEIRRRVEENGMFLETGVSSSHPDVLKKALSVSSILGSSLLRVIPDMKRSSSSDEIQKQLNRIIQDLREILSVAKDLRIRIALENHAETTSEEMLYLIKTVSDDYIGICLDTMNSTALLEHPLRTAELLGPYTLNAHFKDVAIEKSPRGHKIIGVPLGEGVVDFKKVLQILKRNPFDPNIVLELYVDRKENEESTLAWENYCVYQSVRYARSTLNL